MAPKGTKKVSIAGSEDKRSITAKFTVSLAGDFLGMQLIYGGKTKRSLPPVKFPENFSSRLIRKPTRMRKSPSKL